jgi:peptide/nickel transport system substrate-binding protein
MPRNKTKDKKEEEMFSREKWTSLLALVMIVSMVLSACAAPTPEIIEREVLVEKPVVETVVVEKEVLVEKPVVETVVVEKEVPVEKVVKETVEVVVEKEVIVEVTPEPAAGALPRNETLYFNGLQWGSVVGWNPYASTNNNAMMGGERETIFETLYMYNMLDGNSYPLLADGDYTWNDDATEVTFKLKAAAHWSDGTPLTAEDVAYTWATHIKYNTGTGAGYAPYIEDVVAADERTVVIKAKLDEDGKAINPLIIKAFLTYFPIVQKAWTQELEARTGEDAAALLADTAEDIVWSGPYHGYFWDDTKVVYIRDDNYWGQDPSMWGKLPAPKYLAHTIFKDNAAGSVALAQGEVDVSQQFNSNIQILWLNYGLPVSTYLPEAPYGIGASLPTAYYNLKSYGLDQLAVRKAIAIAVDYPTIIANAMTNQSATFEQVPRSLMNPTPGEQALYDHDAVADLQWAGNDIEGAKKLLDDAGITDTDGDGWREYNGQKLSYIATCPNGWSDWQAAIEVVAAAGKKIGIDITTNYPEWAVYQTVVTKSDAPLPEGYDIFMMWSAGAGPDEPWARIRNLLSSEWIGLPSNWSGNWGQYSNPEVDALIQAIPAETDEAKLKERYTELVRIYLTDIPSFTLMYRPDLFHAVNETVWTNFPHQDDGTDPPIPPMICLDGYGVACLYHITLVNP